jgi:hypothetical protein
MRICWNSHTYTRCTSESSLCGVVTTTHFPNSRDILRMIHALTKPQCSPSTSWLYLVVSSRVCTDRGYNRLDSPCLLYFNTPLTRHFTNTAKPRATLSRSPIGVFRNAPNLSLYWKNCSESPHNPSLSCHYKCLRAIL